MWVSSLGGLKLADGGGVGWEWVRPLGGEVGSGVDAAVWALRICWACLWAGRGFMFKNFMVNKGVSGDFCRVFSGDDVVNVRKFHSFSKFHKRRWNDARQTDATARHSNDSREIICDFSFISPCSVPIFL